jgi:hypothetical protein
MPQLIGVAKASAEPIGAEAVDCQGNYGVDDAKNVYVPRIQH